MSKKKKKVGSLAQSNVETYDKSKVIKTVWLLAQGETDPWKRGQSRQRLSQAGTGS